MEKSTFETPIDVITSSIQIGDSLKLARKRRRLTQEDVALRIGATRDVVINAEKGKSVTSHHLFSMLWLFGLLRQSAESISDNKDIVGLSLEKARLPERVKNRIKDEF